MELKSALDIARSCERGVAMAGRYFDPPFTQGQLAEAVICLYKHANLDGPTRDELTLANRRYAAVNAQLAQVKKKHGYRAAEDVDA